MPARASAKNGKRPRQVILLRPRPTELRDLKRAAARAGLKLAVYTCRAAVQVARAQLEPAEPERLAAFAGGVARGAAAHVFGEGGGEDA